MDIKKALISAVVLYALVFLAASALLNVLAELYFGYAMIIIVALLVFVISKMYYFKGVSISDPVKDGLMFGVFLAVVMFVLEVPIMVYGFAAEQGWSYFMTWHIIAGYLMTLVAPIVAAHAK